MKRKPTKEQIAEYLAILAALKAAREAKKQTSSPTKKQDAPS